MSKNTELQELYNSKWNSLCAELGRIVNDDEKEIKPTYPLLIDIGWWKNGVQDESWYTDADVKVMVFGQETNEWAGECDDFGVPPSKVFDPDISLGAVCGVYENFYKSHYTGQNMLYNGNRYGSFHYGFNKLMDVFNKRFADRKTAFIWNNIVKIGKAMGAGFSGKDIYDIERKCFDVVKEEVKILQPDIIVFLTGTYDERIKDVFGNVAFEPITPFALNEVAKVSVPGINIPAFRTSHPSARLQKGEIELRYSAIVNNVKL